MTKIFSRFFLSLLLVAGTALASPVKVVTSTTDLAWAMREIGGPLVEVKSFLKGTENPHFVDAVPEYIRLASNADVACLVGLELEVGWMPKVLARSMNAKVQPGGKGYCEAGKSIEVQEKPEGPVNRSMGDVHPAGNPHFWLSPKQLASASRVLADSLVTADPAHMKEYQEGLKRLSEKLTRILDANRKKISPLVAAHKGPIVLEYHREFTYLFSDYGMKSMGSIEEKPGVPPSAGRLAEVALAAKTAGVRFAIAGDTAPRKTLERFTELSGIPVVVVPLHIQPEGKAKDYSQFQDHLVDSMVKALQSPAG